MAFYYNGCDSYMSYAVPRVTYAAAPVVTTRVASPCSSLPAYFSSYDRPLTAETLAEIESRIQAVSQSVQRTPIVKQERIEVAGPAGRVRNIVRRLPTPQPDVIERTTVIKPGKDQVNIIVEKPVTPPPMVTCKQVVEDPGAPLVNQQTVSVAPRVKCVTRVASPVVTTSLAATVLPTSLSYASRYGWY